MYMYIHDMYTMCIRCVYDMYTICIRYVYDMYTICIRCVNDVYIYLILYINIIYLLNKYVYIYISHRHIYYVYIRNCTCLIIFVPWFVYLKICRPEHQPSPAATSRPDHTFSHGHSWMNRTVHKVFKGLQTRDSC